MVQAAFRSAALFYRNWQGRYADNIVYSLGIGTAIPRFYFLGTWAVLTLFVTVNLWVITQTLREIFEIPTERAYLAAALFTLFQVLYLPYPSQGFFWYLGATSYTGTYSMLILGIYSVWKIGRKNEGKRTNFVIAFLCIAVVAGSNYSTALLAGEILVILLILQLLQKKSVWLHLLLLIEFSGLFAINALDPANQTRINSVELMSPFASILASFQRSSAFAVEWFHFTVLFLTVAIFWLVYPYLWNAKGYRYPIIYSAATFCLYTSMLTPPFYAGGTWGPGRLVNTVYFAYLFVLCSNVLYWGGWLLRKTTPVRQRMSMPIFVGAIAVLFLIALKYYSLQSTSVTSALLSLQKGEAASYRKENEARWELYEGSEVMDVVVDDYTVKPYVLYHDDIIEDPTDWRNVALASFFSKKSVRLRE
ncbi:MAG: hypothetical protein K6A92_01350 [Lachnospiraceae bacterium]|nr:hypothetical protein [Lachnospiraceae bacterium]